jgi:hypothetical protein
MNPRSSFLESIKSEFLKLELRELLQSPPNVLMGVSDEAVETLKKLQVLTVFDLGLSSLFVVSETINGATTVPQTIVARYGKVPTEMVDAAYKDTTPPALPEENVSVLKGISNPLGSEMTRTLGIETIREMALWPPFLAAKHLIAVALNPEVLAGVDPEAPPELVPKTGEFCTDKVFYESVILIEAPAEKKPKPPIAGGSLPAGPRDLETNGPIDLSDNSNPGFLAPANGAILTYSQSWYPKAVSLGQLLYSLPLAPGESTKIAVIDFVRRSLARTQEDISQTEALSSTLVQSRSIAEIATAVADEVQNGKSRSTSESDSESIGVAAGGFVSPVLFGVAAGASRNKTTAKMRTWSHGHRDLSASTQQQINSSTQQNTFSERNKKAAIVAEASQEEREQITTRTVTNYNHMHALSIHYYEVVQLYQTQVRVEKCERALFVPMKAFKFDQKVLERFRGTLFRAALSQRIRQLLVYSVGSVSASLELRPGYRFRPD